MTVGSSVTRWLDYFSLFGHLQILARPIRMLKIKAQPIRMQKMRIA